MTNKRTLEKCEGLKEFSVVAVVRSSSGASVAVKTSEMVATPVTTGGVLRE